MKKIHVTFLVDEKTLLKESGQTSLEAAISQEMGWLHDSGILLDSWQFQEDYERSRCQQMVKDEIELNGAVYGLSQSEISGMKNDAIVVTNLTDTMLGFMNRDGDHEYDALEKAFQSTMQRETQAYRAYTLQKELSGLVFTHGKDGEFSGVKLGDLGHFFVSPSHGLCLARKNFMDDSDVVQICRTISALDPGDAFFVSYEDGNVSLCITPDGSHQNFDEKDDPWIVYDEEENCWFEEDINCEVPDMLERFITGIQEKQYGKEKPTLQDKIQDAAGRAGEGLSSTEKSPEH